VRTMCTITFFYFFLMRKKWEGKMEERN
jgi:hypothetical protein